MNDTRKSFLAAALALPLVFLLISFAQQRNGRSFPDRLGIEIALSDKTFYVPAAPAGRSVVAYIRVPVGENIGSHTEQVSAVKLMPRMEGNRIKVTVYSLFGDTCGVRSCEDWKSLKSTPVAAYLASEGEEITISELPNLGAKFKGGVLAFRVVPARTVPPQSSSGGECDCGWCGRLACCPNPGKCITCGSCGDVCCAPLPE